MSYYYYYYYYNNYSLWMSVTKYFCVACFTQSCIGIRDTFFHVDLVSFIYFYSLKYIK